MSEIVEALELPSYESILVVSGGAAALETRLIQPLAELFKNGLVAAAVDTRALLIDGGTQAGIMELLGKEVRGSTPHVTLTGVTPLSKVNYPGHAGGSTPLDPNHSRFILTDGAEWGDETDTLFRLAEILAIDKPGSCLVILAAGGDISKNEILQAVRRRLPIVIITGSGGLADVLTSAALNKATPPADAAIAEILADGQLDFFTLGSAVATFQDLITGKLGADKNLVDAWQSFANFDLNANRQQQRSDRLVKWSIFLGLVATTLAIVKQVADPQKKQLFPWSILSQLLIIIPIALSVLNLAAQKFKQARKWILLRSAAESVKREIYRYRTRATYYKKEAEKQLSQKLDDISRRTYTTEVNSGAIIQYDRRLGFPPAMYAASLEDDGFSLLSPQRYVTLRLENQLNYFNRKTKGLDRWLTTLTWLGFIIGGAGSYLAAVNEPVWVALTTALSAALVTYLSYRQTEMTLVKYNQTASTLNGIRSWWWSLSPDDKKIQDNIDALVDHTETALQNELEGWVQQMQNALEQLYKAKDDKGGKANPS